jgi:hypothetical protein
MSIARVIGVILLGVGAVLIVLGIVASRSVADSLSSTFRGQLTQHTLVYLIGGIASAVVGLVLTIGNFGRSRS